MERTRHVIEGRKRFPSPETIRAKQALPPEADPLVRERLHSERWLKDFFRGIERPQYQEPEESVRERVLETAIIKLKGVVKFIGGHAPVEIVAFLAQTFHFKPKERSVLMESVESGRTVSEQVKKIEESINASEHLTPEEGTALLEKIWELSDKELTQMDFDALAESGLLNSEYQSATESAFSEQAIQEIKEAIKHSVQTRVDGKKLLLDVVMIALIAKGGVALKFLGKGTKSAVYTIKALKAAKVAKGSGKELRRVWKRKPKPKKNAAA